MYDNNPTDAEGEEMVVETAVWRAHKSSITSMEWLVMEEGTCDTNTHTLGVSISVCASVHASVLDPFVCNPCVSVCVCV